jgi:hypothetical protein
MKIKYHRQDDILILELSKAPVDHAEEAGPIIAHFSPDDELVLLEILDAKDFLARLTKATRQKVQEETPRGLQESLAPRRKRSAR